MKRQFLFALPLLATLALPVVAQQNATADQSQSTGGTITSASSTPARESQLEPLQPNTHEGFWGKVHPWARKKWVQRQLQPIRDRSNELDELTASNTRMLHDVDERATAGIQRADAHATLADQHAMEAGNRAQMALQTGQQADTQLHSVSTAVENLDQYQTADQVEIRFRPGAATLSKSAKEALDNLAATMKTQKGWLVEVQGFSPGRGSTSIQKSQHLADSVVRYLVIEHDIPVYRIHELGLGNAQIATATTGEEQAPKAKGSRVEVTLLRNGVGDLQTTQPAAPSMSEPQSENHAE